MVEVCDEEGVMIDFGSGVLPCLHVRTREACQAGVNLLPLEPNRRVDSVPVARSVQN
jgi:hypothetical protein